MPHRTDSRAEAKRKRSHSASGSDRQKRAPSEDKNSALLVFPDEEAMARILRMNLQPDEAVPMIMTRFPHFEPLAVEKLMNRAVRDIHEGCTDYIIEMYVTVFLNVPTRSFLSRFKEHVGGHGRHPFVHHGGCKGGHDAVDRLQSPFGNKPLFNISTREDSLPIDITKTRVLNGETGIGKTHTVLFSNRGGLVVYLMYDYDFNFEHRLSQQHDSTSFPVIHKKDVTRFVQETLDKCALAFRKTSGLDASHVKAEMRKLHVRIAVDELGQKPNLTQLFIQKQEALQDQLKNPYENWPGCGSVDIVLLGTGISLNLQRTSDADVFERISMKPAPFTFFTSIASQFSGCTEWSDFLGELQECLKSEPSLSYFAALIQNRRAAVLAASEFAELMDEYCVRSEAEMLRVFVAAASAIVNRVTVKFKNLNSWQSLTPDTLRYAAFTAFGMSMPQDACRRMPTPHEFRLYVTRLGVLTDPNWTMMLRAIRKKGGKTEYDVVANANTLTMSPAIRTMLLAFVGFTDLSTQSAEGDAFQRLVALKCVVALQAIAHDNEELCRVLRTAPMKDKSAEPPMPEPTTEENGRVVQLSLQHRLARVKAPGRSARAYRVPAQVHSTLNDIREHVGNGHGVVVQNGAGAPYADVIAIRRGYVGFFRVGESDKYFVPSTAFPEVATFFDDGNARITEVLCDIAGVGHADAELVIVSRREEGMAGTLEPGGQRWRVLQRSDDFLFPFSWPLRDDHDGRYVSSSFAAPQDPQGTLQEH